MGNRIYIQTKALKSGEQRIRVFDDQSDSQWVVLGEVPSTPAHVLAAGYEQEWEIQDILDLGFLSNTPTYFNDENFDLKAFEQQLQAIKRSAELEDGLPSSAQACATKPRM